MASFKFFERLKTRTSSIYWEAPALMLFSFIFAILFAVAHHIFYLYMDGQPASDDDTQQWISRFGTAIAFIAKVLFGVSTSMAYVQWFWYKIRRTPITLRCIDALYGVIYEPMKFWHITVWIRHFPLAFLAVTSWALPISSIFTPGAIFVKSNIVTKFQPLTTLATNLSSPTFCAELDTLNFYEYVRPCTNMHFMAALTMTSGSIVRVPFGDSQSNTSYTTSFHGPAVTCSTTDSEITRSVTRAVNDYGKSRGIKILITAFVPSAGFGLNMNGSFFDNTETDGAGGIPPVVDVVSIDVSRTYLYIGDGQLNSTLYSCNFYNATYRVTFELFSNGDQRATVDRTLLNPIVTSGNGSEWAETVSAPYPVGTTPKSYVSIIYTFNTHLIGTLSHKKRGRNTIRKTTINAQTMNMRLEKVIVRATGNIKDPDPLSFANELKDVYESLMQNFTISAQYGWQKPNLGADDLLFPSDFRNDTVNATVSSFQPEFEYRRRDLAIAYGISTLFSAICIGMGCYAMIKAGGSFSHDFSNIFRLVLRLDLDFDPDKDVRRGADPLPRQFARIVLRPEPDANGKGLAKRAKTIR
ncbi:hypothetical protein CC78DRAFT_534446 [Lojkania enalia]|uniref:Uncharacterized protein n=1 Tax=Lojkania enalia TaxID=147567 RepID=A0A9P4K4T4_9PLEO|nr:hypothetical protein CC78DRAFT_534446 [Didymosphaeria enalia]